MSRCYASKQPRDLYHELFMKQRAEERQMIRDEERVNRMIDDCSSCSGSNIIININVSDAGQLNDIIQSAIRQALNNK